MVYDEQGNELMSYDGTLGKIETREKTIHHEAVEAVAEQSHYETVAAYPNGGKDVQKVIDVQGIQAVEAYDETVQVPTYIPYTQDELAEQERLRSLPTKEERIEALEEAVLGILFGGMSDV